MAKVIYADHTDKEKSYNYDMIFKILVIGDTGVGKSNLLLRYVKNEFAADMRSTVGVEFGTKMMKIEGYDVKAQIWDTAGEERYRAITSAYYKGAKGVLIVYDITRKSSFDNVDKWLNDFKMKSDEDAAIVIVGNKSDLINEREVSKEEATLKAQINHLAFFETSAKENENVHSAFLTLMQQVVKNFKNSNDFGFDGGIKGKKTKKKKNLFNGNNAQNIVLDSNNDGFEDNGFNIEGKEKKKCC